MSSRPAVTIHAFTKPDCKPCARAKAVLDEAGLEYVEHDVTASKRNADASSYFSGVGTVPRVFFGAHQIYGADDLVRLSEEGRLEALLEAAEGSDLPLDQMSDEELAHGGRDVPLIEFIPPIDGPPIDDPETVPLIGFYKEWFGFWPNSFSYLHHYPEATKLFVYGHNFSTFATARGILKNVEATGFASCSAAECAYCTTHTVAAGGDDNVAMIVDYLEARDGNPGDDNPFGPHELAIADLAAKASLNTVTDEDIARVRETADETRSGPADVEKEIEAAELIAATSGFLNTFNDLVDMDIEGGWSNIASTHAGVEPGRHHAEDANPNNLDLDLPEGGPTIFDMLMKYENNVGDLDAYAEREFGLLPAWIQDWPELLRSRHAYMYGELMGNSDHSLFPAELKHLMARVSAIAKGHDYLAAVEGAIAVHCADDKDRAVERVARCFATVTEFENESDGLFTDRECAALKIAFLSAQVPLTTPRRFLQPALDAFDTQELVQLCVVCAIVSLVQRFVAIDKPEIEPEVADFLHRNGIEINTVSLRYPIAAQSPAGA